MKRNTYYIDEKVEKEKVDVKLLKRFLKYIAPKKQAFKITVILLALSTLTALVPPLFIKAIVDKVIPDRNYSLLVSVLAGFVFLDELAGVKTHFL